MWVARLSELPVLGAGDPARERRLGAAQTQAQSTACSVSADGRFVAFASSPRTSSPGDTNGDRDVFVRDRSERDDRARERRLGRRAGEQLVHRRPRSPPTAATWRSTSVATNLVAGRHERRRRRLRPRPPDRHDRARERRLGRGAGERRQRLRPRSPPTAATWRSRASPRTSSRATRTASSDIFVRDRQTGTTERVSVDSGGAQANGDSFDPSISADGRFVAFESVATQPRRRRHERCRSTSSSATARPARPSA